MVLIPLSLLLGEGARKRRTAYSSGRKELIGYEKPQFRRPTRKVKKKKLGRLIARTPLAYKRWRVF